MEHRARGSNFEMRNANWRPAKLAQLANRLNGMIVWPDPKRNTLATKSLEDEPVGCMNPVQSAFRVICVNFSSIPE
jgi:hypothetical protein